MNPELFMIIPVILGLLFVIKMVVDLIASDLDDYIRKHPEVSAIRIWLVKRPWLWKKVVFDNGVVGKNYHRYDHRIFEGYVHGMGDNGYLGNVHTAIEHRLRFLIKY